MLMPRTTLSSGLAWEMAVAAVVLVEVVVAVAAVEVVVAVVAVEVVVAVEGSSNLESSWKMGKTM